MSSKEIVESGYDKIHQLYHRRRIQGFYRNKTELDAFTRLLPKGGSVLDVGCGSGYISSILQQEGFNVTGIDISRKMLELARKYSPGTKFLKMDMSRLEFPAASFDGIVCFYALIHVPRASHRQILKRFRRALKPDGVLAVHMGWSDWVAREEYLGAPMYWSYFDRETNLKMIEDVGFDIKLSKRDTQKDGGTHLYILAQR